VSSLRGSTALFRRSSAALRYSWIHGAQFSTQESWFDAVESLAVARDWSCGCRDGVAWIPSKLSDVIGVSIS